MSQVKTGAFLSYVIILLNALVGLLYTPYMLRMLGQNEYGLYSLVASVIAYLTILDLGFGNAIIRYTSHYRARGQITEQWEMFGMFIVIYTIIGLVTFGLGMILYDNVEVLFDRTMSMSEISQAKVMVLLLICNLAITFPLSIFGSIISAYENFVFQKIIAILRIILSTIVMIVLLYYGYKAIALVVVQTVFNVLTLLINCFYCKYKLHIKILFRRFNFSFLKEVAVYSFWIFLNAIMDRIYWSTGQFILGTFAGTVAVAIYSVAILLQQMYMTFSTAISGVLLPRITSMVAKNCSDKEVSDIFISTGRIQYIIISLVMTGFVIFGSSFIGFWAGDGYHESYWIALIFFISLLIPLIQNTGILVLQARNMMKFRSLLYLAISLVSLVLQIVLTKYFGVFGCAIAVGGALLIGQGLIMNIYYRRKQNLDIIDFWRQISKMSVIPIIFIIIGVITFKYISIDNVYQLAGYILLFLLAYLPLFWKFSTNSYERQMILSPIKRVLHKL